MLLMFPANMSKWAECPSSSGKWHHGSKDAKIELKLLLWSMCLIRATHKSHQSPAH